MNHFISYLIHLRIRIFSRIDSFKNKYLIKPNKVKNNNNSVQIDCDIMRLRTFDLLHFVIEYFLDTYNDKRGKTVYKFLNNYTQ